MKKCKSCKAVLPYSERNGLKTYKHKYGYGINCGCLAKYYLETEEGKDKISKAALKVTKPRRELEEAEKEYKERKGITSILNSVKDICHQYIRKRDEGKPCISCGAPYKDDFQAGHFYKAELYSTLKFDETNIHGQCMQCNLYNDGNESGYRVGLINRFSKGYLDLLDSKALLEKKSNLKWDREKLKEIRKYYREKLKKIKII